MSFFILQCLVELDSVMDRTELSDDCDSIVSFPLVGGSCSASVRGVSHHIFVDIKYMFMLHGWDERPLKRNETKNPIIFDLMAIS
jgi:hypothetical protein